MLQANNYLRENEDSSAAFEDYSIFMYRQNAPEFTDRVKELEQKLLYPVRILCRFRFLSSNNTLV
jgi:F-actin monooxygenase